MRISIIGLGYVGLPLACSFAQAGQNVIGVDVNSNLIDNLKNREYNYTEPKLNEILDNVLDKYMKVDTKPSLSDVFIVTVQTPIKDNGHADLYFVKNALLSIVPYVQDGNLIIVESTVPIGANKEFYKLLRGNIKTDISFDYCYCPEAILPNNVFYELKQNHRVIGGIDINSRERAKTLYDYINIEKKTLTDIATAEFVKLVQNAHRDVELAFVNQLSMMCDIEDVNVFNVINIANQHPRCNLLYPGSGVGGHCIAIDPYFLIEKFGDNASLLSTAREVNNQKPIWVANKAINKVKTLQNKKIGLLGLSYKPNSDDCRESSGMTIYKYLEAKGYEIFANEPNIIGDINGVHNYDTDYVLNACDVIIIAQRHTQYLLKDFSNKILIDVVNILGN